MERDRRVVRKGKPPEEWTAVSVKRVLVQPINAGTLVYHRRRANGKTHVPPPPMSTSSSRTAASRSLLA